MKSKKILSFLFVSLVISLSSCGVNSNKLYIGTLPKKVSFNVGEEFTSEGLTVYDVNNKVQIKDYSLSFEEGEILNEVGNFTVEVKKSKFESYSYDITVSKYHEMNIASYPEKSKFKQGEYFSISGLRLIDEEGNNITNYEVSKQVGNSLNEPGTFDIFLSKTGYVTASYKIEVLPINSMAISNLPHVTSYEVGDTFSSEGIKVIDTNYQTQITDYNISLKDGTTLRNKGTIKVLVNKEGYPETSFNITVSESSKHPSPIENKTLNIYYINDTHGSFVRDISTGSSKFPEAGMAYIGDYLKKEKAKDPKNTLILSGGDMFQGGVESNFTDGAIMVDAMNEIGFDAMVCGNHEFDWKPEILAERESEMNFPLLSCNIFKRNSTVRPSFLKPYTIIEKDGYKVGIIGAAKKDLGDSVLKSISSQFDFPSPGTYVAKYADELRLSYQCDVVLLVAHDGGTTSELSNTLASDYSSLTSISSLSGSRYVDAMFFAHDHYKKQFVENDVPVIESACNGEYIGEISLSLDGRSGFYTVSDHSISGLSTYAANYCTNGDEYILSLPTSEPYATQIGDPNRVLYDFDEDYTEEDFAYLTCQILYWYVDENKSLFGGENIYFSDVNKGMIRCSVKAGEFTIRDLVKVCPFQNEIAIQYSSSKNVNRVMGHQSIVSYVIKEPPYQTTYVYGASVSYVVEKYNTLQTDYHYYGKTIYDAYLTYFKEN